MSHVMATLAKKSYNKNNSPQVFQFYEEKLRSNNKLVEATLV